MRVTLLKGASPGLFPLVRTAGPIGLVALLLVAGCDRPIAGPRASQPSLQQPSRDASATAITTYTDRATWEAAVATAGGTVVNMNFTGLTTGRVTQLDTDYGAFRIVVDDVAASSFSNPGIDIFPDAGCSLGTGDCYVFTFNLLDPTSLFDGPKTNQLIFPQPIMAFGGDFIQAGYTAPPAVATGPVTLHFGTETVVINDYVNSSGNGFFGFIATTPVTTIEFTFAKSGTIQNDIFQVYNPAYANGTLPPPATPEEMIADLRIVISDFGLAKGMANSLDSKLRAALSALDAGQMAQACTSLQDLINYANAQSGKKLTASDAASIVAAAVGIRTELGC